MVKLEVQIDTLKINAIFRIFDNDDSIFDIIINLKTKINYHLLVDVESKYLYVKNNTNKINGIFTLNVVRLALLEDVCAFHSKPIFCHILERKTNINNLFSTN